MYEGRSVSSRTAVGRDNGARTWWPSCDHDKLNGVDDDDDDDDDDDE